MLGCPPLRIPTGMGTPQAGSWQPSSREPARSPSAMKEITQHLGAALPRSLVWLYYGNHIEHPFIRVAAESLASTGIDVTVIDRAVRSLPHSQYRHRGYPIPI